MKTISIIVPIYNCEKYLDRCLNSLPLNSTWAEIILINDGSTDNSPNICNNYSQQFQNVTVIHTKNNGVSCARNIGIKKASGEWLLFVDADDWINCKNIELLYNKYKLNKYNLIQFGISLCNDTTIIKNNKCVDQEYATLSHYKKAGQFRPQVWNFLFKKQLIKQFNIYFNETLKYGEDQLFTISYIKNIEKRLNLLSLDIPIYNYFQNNESAVHKQISTKIHCQNLEVCNKIISLGKDSSYPHFYYSAAIEITKFFLRQCYLYNWKKEDLKYIKKIYNQTYKKLPLDIKINTKGLYLIVPFISFKLYLYILNKKHSL